NRFSSRSCVLPFVVGKITARAFLFGLLTINTYSILPGYSIHSGYCPAENGQAQSSAGSTVNQRQLEVFHAIMLHRTASRAAEVLFMSEPAVSKTIQQLERSIGFALFDRVKGRMVPTSEGQLFHEEVARSFVGITQLRQTAA